MEGLSAFLSQNFTGWKSVSLNDLENLVIDGNSVCSQLYMKHHGGVLGGDYPRYHATVREYFTEILFTGVQVIVVLNGIDHDQLKMDADRKCRTDSNLKLMRFQGRMGWQDAEVGVTPLMTITVFKDALRSLGVRLRVADGDAGKEAAALANHLKCPVLSADSNYYMYELHHGYIPFNQLSTVIANGLLYHVREFQRQFDLKDPKLRFAIPARRFIKRAIRDTVDLNEEFLKRLATYETAEHYLADQDSDDTRRGFEMAIKSYCELPLPIDHDPRDPASSPVFIDHPEWVIRNLREGYFQPQLLNVCIRNVYLMEAVVEDIKRESAWLTSRNIRQHLYGFMGVSGDGKIREITRAKSSPEVIEVQVSPSNFENPATYKDFLGTSREKLAHVVLAVLKCHEISPDDMKCEFEKLNEEWKLPIAATFYWYRTCNDPPAQRHLVKSLLLSFLTCSDIITYRIPPLERVTRDTKVDHLASLHAFAQWQCVYYDAISLNQLTREPFQTTSPHRLFSGEVAMYLFVRMSHQII